MFILTNKNLLPSVRVLRERIEELSGNRLVIKTLYPEEGTIAIRWGNSSIQNDIADDMNLNSALLIREFSNKKLFSEEYKNDFWVLEFRKDNPNLAMFPLLIRQTMTGFGGKGIIPCNSTEEFVANWDISYYWTKYINMSSEYRVHVFDGDILRIFKKIREEGEPEEEFKIRNAHRGYKFSAIDNPDSLPGLRKLAKMFWNKTTVKFNIEHGFFALDIGWCPEQNNYFILEGNTAPGIANNPNTCTKYAEKFIEILHL